MSEFVIHVSEGKVLNKKVFAQEIIKLRAGKYLVKIASIKKRSLPQNAYLHGVIIPLVFEGLRNIGWDEIRDNEDAKNVIKELFLKRKIENKNTGETITIVRKTSELTTVETAEFIEDIIKWAAEYLSIQIPYPNEQMALYE